MDIFMYKQIKTEDNGLFQLYLTLHEDSVKIILFQNDNAWKSIVIKKRLEHFANEHKVTLENYYENLQDYVKNDKNLSIVFVVDNEEFIINKRIKETLIIKYFTCKLIKVNYQETVEQSMQNLYLQNTKFQEQVKQFEKENTELRKQKEQYEAKLKELVEQKKAFENNQYSQFLLILNEKKRKIQHLTELLEAFNKGSLPVQPVAQLKNKRKKGEKKNAPVRKLETISESDSTESEEIPTSDDENVTNEEKVDIKPSTSVENYDFLNDESPTDPILPKRFKPSTSNVQEPLVIPTETPPEKTEELDITENKSPTIDLSTQQLLDLL